MSRMPIDLDAALASNAWPFQEAEKLLKRLNGQRPAKGYVLFETGYGPSGLPHIGTFGEVFRTTMVRQAFERLSDIPTRLIAFSDDMDGLRKVPDNVPNREMVAEHLHKPLTEIPDPFGTAISFGDHMNGRLIEFLREFNFDFEFKSSTKAYCAGEFDKALLAALRGYDEIMAIMLPTLGEERQKTYSPFMPICPESRHVLQVPTLHTDPENGTITYLHPNGQEVETKVTGGACKLQWKPDWGMRWAAFEVDYEMHGKDLTPSAVVSAKIARVISKHMDRKTQPPLNYVYEMFLDEEGGKISKSRGNGLSLEEWLKYGTPESLALFMFNNPRKAKRLHFDVIPKHVDEYLQHLASRDPDEHVKLLKNPVWHIHNGDLPEHSVPLSFSLLLNLAAACNPEDASVLWGFITRYAPDATPEKNKMLNELVRYALAYYEDFIKPNKDYATPDDQARAALAELAESLGGMADDLEADEYQTAVFTVGKNHGYENLREWFQVIYQVLLGQSQGPRMGSFIALYGRKETIALIHARLSSR